MQVEGKSDCPYLCDPFGGTTWGLTVGAGGSVRKHLGIGAELSRVGTLTGSQSLRTGLFSSFQSETVHRDTIGSLVLRFSPAAADDPVSLIVLAGGGIALRQTTRTGEIVRTDGGPNSPREDKLRDIVPAAPGVVDLPIRVGRRTAVVPFARGHYLFDSDRTDDGLVKRGVSSFIFRAGATIEVRF